MSSSKDAQRTLLEVIMNVTDFGLRSSIELRFDDRGKF